MGTPEYFLIYFPPFPNSGLPGDAVYLFRSKDRDLLLGRVKGEGIAGSLDVYSAEDLLDPEYIFEADEDGERPTLNDYEYNRDAFFRAFLETVPEI